MADPTPQHRDEAHELLALLGRESACDGHYAGYDHSEECDAVHGWLSRRDDTTRDTAVATARAEGKAEGLAEGRAQVRESMLSWRGVDDPCEKCGGAGRRLYGSTATWRGGAAGQMVTADVCDRCWGTGDKHRHGVNLRALSASGSSRRAEGMRGRK